VFTVDEQDNVTDWLELDVRKYRSLIEAIAGHNEMVTAWGSRP
jgi:hypothetical protein